MQIKDIISDSDAPSIVNPLHIICSNFESTVTTCETEANDEQNHLETLKIRDHENYSDVSDCSFSDTDSEVDVTVVEKAFRMVAISEIILHNYKVNPAEIMHQSVTSSENEDSHNLSEESNEQPSSMLDLSSSSLDISSSSEDEYTPTDEALCSVRRKLPMRKRKHGLVTLNLPSTSSETLKTLPTPLDFPLNKEPLKVIRYCSNPNCRTEDAKAWRFLKSDPQRLSPYCSPCKLYYDSNKRQRPTHLIMQPRKTMRLKNIPISDRQCRQCETRRTPLWRFIGDELFCNACAQYFKKHKIKREKE